MIGGSFVGIDTTINGTNGFTLADLSVAGYQKPKWDPDAEDGIGAWVGGVHAGGFTLKVLGPTGAPKATYMWLDFKDGIEDPTFIDDERDPGWYDENADPIADPSSADCTFFAGQTFWISGTGKSLVSAGAVNVKDIAFKTESLNYCSCGNGTPVSVNLGEMFVSGYLKPTWDPDAEDGIGSWVGGVHSGGFTLLVLGPTGAPTATYLWLDFKDGIEDPTFIDDERDPGWYDENADPVDYKQPECTFKAGQGFWVSGSGLFLNVPAPEL